MENYYENFVDIRLQTHLKLPHQDVYFLNVLTMHSSRQVPLEVLIKYAPLRKFENIVSLNMCSVSASWGTCTLMTSLLLTNCSNDSYLFTPSL